MTDSETLKRHRTYLDGAPRPALARAASPSAPRRWLIVETEYRRELTAEGEITKAGYLVYVPRFKTRARDRSERKWIDATRPLFPGYLFADCGDEETPAGWLAKRRGVRDLVKQGDEPVRVADAVIERLRKDEGINFGQPYRTAGPALPYQVTEQVRITDGQFTGFYGVIGAVDARDRITVFIQFLGGVSKLQGLTVAQLERASADKP